MIGNDMYNGEMPEYPGPYDQDNVDTSNFNSWGHFSQIVWKGTQQVGCATQNCPGGVQNAQGTNDFTVCNYQPAGKPPILPYRAVSSNADVAEIGNIQGGYSNVGAPLGKPIIVELTNS